MKNQSLLALALTAPLLVPSVAKAAKSTKTPKKNIVLLFVDDLGWADLGYRNSVFDTPNIDALADEGVDFSRAYVAQPASSASRAGLLTGKEPVRTGVVRHIENKDAGSGREFNMWPNDPINMPSRNWLQLEETTFAERIQEDYHNVFVGKWHLGGPEYWPMHQGYDECFGLSDFGNVSDYYAPFFVYPRGENTTKDVPEGEFMCDYLTDYAVNFIENYNDEKPFQLSLFYYDVHTPNIGRKDLVAKYIKEGLSAKYANYAAQVAVVDQSVGQVRAAIEKAGIADNTIIIFTSDQGGFFTNAPLRGGKPIDDTFAEGGLRVPMIILDKDSKVNGTEVDTPVSTIDLYPTIVEIAKGKKCKDKQIQGTSLLPLLAGKTIKDRNLYFWRSYHDQYAALVCGDWKLIKWYSGEYDLYNLRYDESETTNLINQEPERLEKMKAELWKWELETIPTYQDDYRNRITHH